MCDRESAKDIQKCEPYTIWVYRVQGRVNKGRVQCARAWIGPESWIIHYYYFICLFPGDRPRPWVTRNWLFGLRCVWKEAADRVYILCAFLYNIMCSVQDPANTPNPPYARVHEQLYINTLYNVKYTHRMNINKKSCLQQYSIHFSDFRDSCVQLYSVKYVGTYVKHLPTAVW